MNHLIAPKGCLLEADCNIRVQILSLMGRASLPEAASAKASLEAGTAPAKAAPALGPSMEYMIKDISEHIIHIHIAAVKMELMIGAVAGAVASRAIASISKAAKASLEARAVSRAGGTRSACLIKGRKSELIIQLFLLRIA